MEEEKDIFDFIEKRKVEMPDKAYFDNLAKSVIESQKTKIIPLYKRPATWIGSFAAAAAVILAFVLIDFADDPIIPTTDPLAELNNIPKKDILAYIDDNIEDFDIELIAEFVPMDQLDIEFNEVQGEVFETTNQEIETVSFDNITKEDILEYLEDEEIDFSDLDSEDSFI